MLRCTKDPDARMDYGVDWAGWLVGDDVIQTSAWNITGEGLTVEHFEFTDTSATIWISGGVVGRSYEMVNRITTLGGRRDDRTIIVRIGEK